MMTTKPMTIRDVKDVKRRTQPARELAAISERRLRRLAEISGDQDLLDRHHKALTNAVLPGD